MPKTLQIKLWKWNSSLLLRLPLFVTVIKRAVSFMVFNPIRDAMIVENMFALSKLCNTLSGLVCGQTVDALVHDVVLTDCAFFNLGVVCPRGHGEDLFHFKQLFLGNWNFCHGGRWICFFSHIYQSESYWNYF